MHVQIEKKPTMQMEFIKKPSQYMNDGIVNQIISPKQLQREASKT